MRTFTYRSTFLYASLFQERLSLNREMLAGLLTSRLEANRIRRLAVEEEEEEEERPKSRKRILLLISAPIILSLLLSLLLLI
jgi:hypothetical protein